MIYFIDDDESVRRGFAMFLKSAGLDFISFENAEEFIAQYKPDSRDLLVLDMYLPGMSGCDLLKKFVTQNVHMPVIVITASDDPQNREYCREYGVKAYLRKPVDAEALLDLINFNIPA
jgi:two-component system, LuxR family, response regulator FixJ